jgi:hypothetical protein
MRWGQIVENKMRSNDERGANKKNYKRVAADDYRNPVGSQI